MAIDQDALVRAILRSPRIRGKIVVLCEGDPIRVDLTEGAPSPQMYGQLEHTPDSAFYAACVPRDWHGRGIPRFFNCGGRSHVLDTFVALQEAHAARPEKSYLTPDKLFALVDLDICMERMPEGYPWATTEEVHAEIYSDGLPREQIDLRHRIWTTALVHKEAFFVLPGVERTWNSDSTPFLDGAPVVLRDLHAKAAGRLQSDVELAEHLGVLEARVRRFPSAPLECENMSGLHRSWFVAAQRASYDEYEVLVRALLSVAKIKATWSRIEPDPNLATSLSTQSYREQLELNIGRQIASLDPRGHSLAGFFTWLKQHR